jgi:hypothetical protein
VKSSSLWKALGVACATGFVVATTLLDTRIAFLNRIESDLIIVALNRAQVLLGPLAVLLFAFCVHWAVKRQYGRALLALPALPVWSLVLLEVKTFTGASAWASLFLAHSLRGLQPFGATPS